MSKKINFDVENDGIINEKEEIYNPMKVDNSASSLPFRSNRIKTGKLSKIDQEALSREIQQHIGDANAGTDDSITTAGILRVPVELTEDDKRRLNIRRRLEWELVKRFDRTEITRKECWYLMDAQWLNAWAAFASSVDREGKRKEDAELEVGEGISPPGPVTSKDLLDGEGKPLAGLRSRIDYRGVPPIVFFIFCELYGRDQSPELCRYTVDIYQRALPVERLVDIQYKAQKDAKVQVNKIRPEWLKWTRDEFEEEEEEWRCCWCCCGGLTKEHLEALLYWCVMCWAYRSSAQRSTHIRYSQYKPLARTGRGGLDDSTHGSSHGRMEREQSRGNHKNVEGEGEEEGEGEGGGGKKGSYLDSRVKLILSDFDSSGFADKGAEKGTWLNQLFLRNHRY